MTDRQMDIWECIDQAKREKQAARKRQTRRKSVGPFPLPHPPVPQEKGIGDAVLGCRALDPATRRKPSASKGIGVQPNAGVNAGERSRKTRIG